MTRRVYAIRSREFFIGERRYLDDVLVELENRKELLALHEAESECAGTKYRRVDSSYAHKWVRDGYQHETPLWLDGNFIRYAKE